MLSFLPSQLVNIFSIVLDPPLPYPSRRGIILVKQREWGLRTQRTDTKGRLDGSLNLAVGFFGGGVRDTLFFFGQSEAPFGSSQLCKCGIFWSPDPHPASGELTVIPHAVPGLFNQTFI